MAKRTYPRVTTPRGVLIYPHLTEPDTKFVKDGGEYHTKFALQADDDATEAFIEKLEEVRAAYIKENPDELKPAVLKKAKQTDLYEEEVDDEGNETGRVIFKFKLKAVVQTANKSWEQKPRLFDSAAEPIADDISIWTGSEGKCNLELFPYFMQTTKEFGVSMRVKAVQILKLESGGSGGSADDFGFGEEDGFVSESSGSSNGFENESEDYDDDDEF